MCLSNLASSLSLNFMVNVDDFAAAGHCKLQFVIHFFLLRTSSVAQLSPLSSLSLIAVALSIVGFCFKGSPFDISPVYIDDVY